MSSNQIVNAFNAFLDYDLSKVKNYSIIYEEQNLCYSYEIKYAVHEDIESKTENMATLSAKIWQKEVIIY